MQESITLRTYIYEAGVEAGHELAHLAQIDVADRVASLFALLVLVFYQIFVFEQGDRDLFRLNINNYFTCHSLVVWCSCTGKERSVEQPFSGALLSFLLFSARAYLLL